ncbi:hypothetical protein C7T94_12220 [Pedobacter yulinensis]|uniref:Uncharacterized protein n=1 Tax=Pedobacter yulinensis TaxID=2126353 RepID=A0A2T3HLK1_9SPHI|nr:hypothetical protein [Pedobacter yulinensis]PST83338.1 hypothetical protein C7T94_12220 [Pedobacter yulinensis]
MKRILYALIPLLCLACQPGADKQNTAILLPPKEAAVYFSDSTKKDTFRLTFNGKTLASGTLVFSISKADGREIYRTSIAAKDLFANYDSELDLSKEKNQAAFLTEEVNRFFDEENFLIPAVTENEQADANVPDKAFYEELKKSRLNGFKYRLGKETNVYIGWSAAAGGVRIYYKCC